MLEVLREVPVQTSYRRRTPNPTSPRTRTSVRENASLMQRTSLHILPTSRGRLIRRRDPAMFAVILITGLRDALTDMSSVKRAARPLMLSFVILR
jgi:hypothetical protein